jgi:hypothetical protein
MLHPLEACLALTCEKVHGPSQHSRRTLERAPRPEDVFTEPETRRIGGIRTGWKWEGENGKEKGTEEEDERTGGRGRGPIFSGGLTYRSESTTRATHPTISR